MAHSSQIEDEVDALYDLRPGEFVAARDALARQVRRGGDRAQADRIKALPRPSAAAWAVNQLARREPEWTQALTTAGRRMAEAHTALLEDGDREGWRRASAEAREAIDRLVRLAEGLLREERGSVSNQLREQVRETLQAAATDPAARELVATGRLTRELRPPGGLPNLAGGRFARPSGTGARGTAPRGQARAATAAPLPAPHRRRRRTGGARRPTRRRARRARPAAPRREGARHPRRSPPSAPSRRCCARRRRARRPPQELATAQAADAERARELESARATRDDAHRQLEARTQAVAAARETLDGLTDAPELSARRRPVRARTDRPGTCLRLALRLTTTAL